MRLINNHALDCFFGYISHISARFKMELKEYIIGDFVYWDCLEVLTRLKPKQKEHFVEFMQRNPFQIIDYETKKERNIPQGDNVA